MITGGHFATYGEPWWVAVGQSRVGGRGGRIYIPGLEAFTTIFSKSDAVFSAFVDTNITVSDNRFQIYFQC